MLGNLDGDDFAERQKATAQLRSDAGEFRPLIVEMLEFEEMGKVEFEEEAETVDLTIEMVDLANYAFFISSKVVLVPESK